MLENYMEYIHELIFNCSMFSSKLLRYDLGIETDIISTA